MIQQRDILFINFFTLNKEMNDILNIGSSRYSANLFQSETSLYINGYTVNDSGNISLPMLGEIKVEGFTIDEITRRIQARTNEFINDATNSLFLRQLEWQAISLISAIETRCW
jgi:polysaccharide export outer membrane protein